MCCGVAGCRRTRPPPRRSARSGRSPGRPAWRRRRTGRCGRRPRRTRSPASRACWTPRRPQSMGEVALEHESSGRARRRPPRRCRAKPSRRSWVQPKRSTPVITSGRRRPSSSRCRAADAPPARLVVATDGNCGLLVRGRRSAPPAGRARAVGRCRSSVPSGSITSRPSKDFAETWDGELLHRLLTPVAGEQQQPVALGLDHVDRALQHLAHPGPGERGDQHADDPGPAAGQADRAGAGHVAELGDHLADPLGGAQRPARPCR